MIFKRRFFASPENGEAPKSFDLRAFDLEKACPFNLILRSLTKKLPF